MNVILAWVLRNPLTSALIAAILLLSAGIAAQTYRLNGVRAEAAEARAALTNEQAKNLVCEANVTSLEGAVEAQNKAIEQAAKQAAQVATTKTERATKVLTTKLPVASAPGADAMNEWLESLQ